MAMDIECDGHTYRLRVLDPADMLDLIESAGENAGNKVWLRFAMLACSVQAIDDVPVPFPRDVLAIKGLARKLGISVLEQVRHALASNDPGNGAHVAKN